ncbi:MAG TPA: efflux RND transporter periplasmic adaptor subunit [Terriglobales bacterium]|nr:efflux RND transporter periplasmic adaptor subunit [Terriglobales bacterium]
MRTLTRRQRSGALALAACLALLGCGRHSAEANTAAGPVPDVTVAKVERGVIAQDLAVSGNVTAAPNRDAKLGALVTGRIAKVLVAEGDSVKQGQPLVELEDQPLLDQVRQAEAAVAQAKANEENARRTATREEGLLERGISSRKEVEDARTQMAVNEAARRSAEAALSVARTQLSRSVIRAPFNGTVVHRFLGVGEQVDGAGSQPVVEVASIDTLELLGTVPASRLQKVRVGENFTFQTPEASDVTFTASVVAVLPAVDPATNNGTVRIRIENAKHQLKFGTFLTLTLPIQESRTRLIVPRQAIYPDENGEPRVYKVTGDRAESVAVEVGIETKDKAEIRSGVKEGDTVIVIGGYGLPEKARVHVK